MSLRDELLKAWGEVPTEEHTDSATGKAIEVRGLLVKDANALYDSITKRDPRTGDVSVDRDRWNVAWVLACAFNPETGEPIFEDADRDTLLGSAAFPVQEVAAVATRLNGYGVSDDDAARELKSEPVP